MDRQVSRRGLITLGGLGVLAAIVGQDVVRREAFAAANQIAAMTATGRYPWVRDRIEINPAWVQELRTELLLRGIARGTTLCLIAREVVHEPGYNLRLPGYPIVVAADTYDGRSGAIDTTEYTARGSTAAPITLIARQVVWARLVANGIQGAAGEPGEPGTPGDAAEADIINGRPVCTMPATNGGPGGDGLPGERGGNGGAIAVYTVGELDELLLENAPGAGGPGGLGGPGGPGGAGAAAPGCRPGRPGPGGFPGAAGLPGTAGATVVQSEVSLADWFTQVNSTLGPQVSEQWGDYRTRVGEFVFRTYTPVDPPTVPPVRDLARRELDSALALFALAAPAKFTAGRARTLLGYLDNALTPIGLSYQHDLRPDFTFFEEFITAYQGRRDALFDSTLRLLLDVQSTADKSHLAEALRSHAAGMALSAQKDYELAISKRDQAGLQLNQARNKLGQARAILQKIIDDHLRDDDEINFGDFVKGVVAVAGAVVAIATAIHSGGSSIAAYLSVIGLAATTAAAAGEAATGIFVDVTDPAAPKPTAAATATTGDLKKVFDNTVKLVDKGRALAQLFAAEGDDEFKAKEREQMVKVFDSGFDVNMKIIDQEQSRLAADSARIKWEVYQADAQIFQNLQAGFQQDLTLLIRVARAVLRQFQTYVDHFIAYGFKRDRAFDLYTLSVPARAPRFPFDYGYVHPDREEDAYLALARNDSSRVLTLLESYVTSLAQFEPAQLREEYDDYWTQLSFDGNVAVSITDPDVLQSLKGSLTTSFTVDPAVFGAHTELKIGRAEVALIGATTKPTHQWVQVELEHTGSATNTRRDGTVVTFESPLRSEASPAQIVAINPDDLDETQKQIFWGRSPAARWRITITPLDAAAAELDLTALTEIQLAIKYAYYNPTAGLARKRP